jgi:hypothetical protein
VTEPWNLESLMIQASILVCSPDPRILHTAEQEQDDVDTVLQAMLNERKCPPATQLPRSTFMYHMKYTFNLMINSLLQVQLHILLDKYGHAL